MRRCSECRRWEANLSQAGSLKRRFHFFRVLIGNFTNNLEIPPRFAVHFIRGKHVQALLRGPSGNVWNVKLKRSGRRFFFMKGWEEFVEDHHLDEGDFLTFRYDGSLRFTVLIFDRTACQREDAKFAKKTRNATKHERTSSEDSVQIVSQICGAPNDLSMHTHAKYTSVETGEAGSQHKEETIREGLAEIVSQPSEGDKEEASSQHKEETVREDLAEIVSQPYEGNKEKDSSQHKEETIREDLAEIVSQPYEGNKEKDSSQHKEETIIEDLAEIVSQPYEGHKGEASSRQKEETIREHSGKIVSEQFEGDKEASVDSKFVIQHLHGRDQVDGSKQRCTYFLPSRRAATSAEKAMILKAACSFKSCCPFCIIAMKPYSVSYPYDMNIPVEFVGAHLSQRKYSTIVLRNATGGEWTVSVYRRSNTLMLFQEWPAFVHANNLMEGDVCIFELLREQNDFVLNVIIYRVLEEFILLGVVHEN